MTTRNVGIMPPEKSIVNAVSIEERPACVASRERFGDWELDLVIGSNSGKDHVLMTLLERKTPLLQSDSSARQNISISHERFCCTKERMRRKVSSYFQNHHNRQRL